MKRKQVFSKDIIKIIDEIERYSARIDYKLSAMHAPFRLHFNSLSSDAKRSIAHGVFDHLKQSLMHHTPNWWHAHHLSGGEVVDYLNNLEPVEDRYKIIEDAVHGFLHRQCKAA